MTINEESLGKFLKESERAFMDIVYQHVFHPETIPPPEPKKEYWMTKQHEMVVLCEGMAYKTLSSPGELAPSPYAKAEDVDLWRRCTGFDF